MKKRLAWVMVVAMVLSFAFAVPVSAEEEFTVHAKAPAEWTTPGLWAWSAPDGTNVFSAWPGQTLTPDPDNAGWFYYSVPTWTNSIIINDNGAGSQTVDVTVESKELWITVTEAGDDGKYAADVVYEAPADFVVAGASDATVDAAATDTAAADATAADAADAAAATDVPKTGVASLALVYMGLAGISGAGLIAAKKRKAS